MSEEKIIQIMQQSKQMNLIYEDEDKTQYKIPVICLALLNNGEIIPITYINGDKCFSWDNPFEDSNFIDMEII